MAVLKEAGVVDAGGKGFVRMLEGVVRYIEGDPILAAAPRPTARALRGTGPGGAGRGRRRAGLPVLHRGAGPGRAAARRPTRCGRPCTPSAARSWWPSWPTSSRSMCTPTPRRPSLAMPTRWGRVETTKADDMRAQHRRLAHADRRPVAIVTDTSADLADACSTGTTSRSCRCRSSSATRPFGTGSSSSPRSSTAGSATARELPTTSQPTPAEFVRVLRDARSEADEVVGGAAVRQPLGHLRVGARRRSARRASAGATLVDSRSASLGVGMLALRGAELAEAGWARRGHRGRSSSGCAASRGCCSRSTATTTCSAPAGCRAARPGSRACST